MNVQNTRNRVLGSLQSEMVLKLSNLMDEVCPKNEIVRIDKIVLNLGTVKVENFQSVFISQLYDGIFKAIRKAQKETNIHQTKKNGTALGSPKSTSPSKSALLGSNQPLNAFIFMLENGFMPWWCSFDSVAQWQSFFQTDILGSVPDKPTKNQVAYRQQIKYVIIANVRARKRLIMQFNKESVWHLVEYWFPDQITLFRPMHQGIKDLFKVIDWPFNEVHEKRLASYFLDAVANNSTALLSSLPPALTANNWIWLMGSQNEAAKFVKKVVDIKNRTLKFKQLTKASTQSGKWMIDLVEIIQNSNKSVQKVKPKIKKSEILLKKEKSPTEPKLIESLAVDFAGIVILWPMLSTLFLNRELTDKGEFKSSKHQMKALQLLNYLVSGENEMEEFQMPINKLLCGLELDEVPEFDEPLSAEDREEVENLLQHVINNWPAIKSTTPAGLRAAFIARKGELTEFHAFWQLNVEESGVDILLSKLPWGYHNIKLPWMSKLMQVEW